MRGIVCSNNSLPGHMIFGTMMAEIAGSVIFFTFV